MRARGSWSTTLGLTLVLGLAGACSDDDTPPSGDIKIGPAGGSVQRGAASVSIPKDALSEDVAIGLAKVEPSAKVPEGLELAGDAYAFTPHGTTFTKLVQLSIPYEGEASVVLRLDDENDTSWEEVDSATFGGGEASISTLTFSIYVAARSDEPKPDTSAPDAGVADGPAPDTVAPDTMAPDTMAPDTMAPDTMAPDTMAPDAMAPDAMAPDTSVSDAGATDAGADDMMADASASDAVAPDAGADAVAAGCPLVGTWELSKIVCVPSNTDMTSVWAGLGITSTLTIAAGAGGACEVAVDNQSASCHETETQSWSAGAGDTFTTLANGIDSCDPQGCTFASGDAACAIGDRQGETSTITQYAVTSAQVVFTEQPGLLCKPGASETTWIKK